MMSISIADRPSLIQRSLTLLAALAALLVHGAAARAQSCQGQWLSSGDVLAGFNGSSHAVISWDQDGAGPMAPVLVVGGLFSVAADVTVNNIAAWDGSRWSALGTGLDGAVTCLAVLQAANSSRVGRSITLAVFRRTTWQSGTGRAGRR